MHRVELQSSAHPDSLRSCAVLRKKWLISDARLWGEWTLTPRGHWEFMCAARLMGLFWCRPAFTLTHAFNFTKLMWTQRGSVYLEDANPSSRLLLRSVNSSVNTAGFPEAYTPTTIATTTPHTYIPCLHTQPREIEHLWKRVSRAEGQRSRAKDNNGTP